MIIGVIEECAQPLVVKAFKPDGVCIHNNSINENQVHPMMNQLGVRGDCSLSVDQTDSR